MNSMTAMSDTGTSPQNAMKLEDLIKRAWRKNPKLESLKHEAKAKKERITPAASLPDPMLGLGLVNYPVDGLSASESPMTGQELRLSQKIPFPGKLSQKEQAATHEYRATRKNYEAEKLLIQAKVQKTFLDLYLTDRTYQIIQNKVSTLEELEKNANSLYSVGKAVQQDVLKAQVALSKAKKRLIKLEERRQHQLARLSRLVNAQSLSLQKRLHKFPEKFKQDFSSLDREDLIQLMSEHSPVIKLSQERTQKSQEQLDLAKTNYYPDFEIGAKYRFRQSNVSDMGDDFVSVFVGIRIPFYFFSKQIPLHRSASEELHTSKKQKAHVLQKQRERIRRAHSQFRQANRLIRLYKDHLLEESKQALESAELSYEVGKVEFITLLDNENALFEQRVGFAEAKVERAKALSDLEATTGMPLREWQQELAELDSQN